MADSPWPKSSAGTLFWDESVLECMLTSVFLPVAIYNLGVMWRCTRDMPHDGQRYIVTCPGAYRVPDSPRAALCRCGLSSILFSLQSSFCPQHRVNSAHAKATNDCHLAKVWESYMGSFLGPPATLERVDLFLLLKHFLLGLPCSFFLPSFLLPQTAFCVPCFLGDHMWKNPWSAAFFPSLFTFSP